MQRRVKPDHRLLAQAALVVLPVVFLSGFALYDLRQDKASIERDARERAAALAPEMARRIGDSARDHMAVWLADRGTALLPHGFISSQGRVVSPPDYEPVPSPPEWPNRLRPVQSEAWRTAQEALFRDRRPDQAQKILRGLATSQNPALRANAEYELLLLDVDRTGPGLAYWNPIFQRCVRLAESAGDIPTESGAPLGDLAVLLALRHSPPKPSPIWNVLQMARASLDHPSFLTPEVVAAAVQTGVSLGMAEDWDRREKLLARLRPLAPQLAGLLGPPREIIVGSGGDFSLALCHSAPGGWRVTLCDRTFMAGAFQSAWRASAVDLPDYAVPVVEFEGAAWPLREGVPRADYPVLATAPGILATSPPRKFLFRLELYGPSLYAAYRRRVWLTGALILSAAATALIGLTILWQGFRRQARLSEMKSNFVSSVSHELRAPIGAVRLMAESLDRGAVAGEAKQKEYFGLIVRECRRLSALVENVLDFSRIDQGRKQYRFEPVDAVAQVRQAVALMAPYAVERQVQLEFVEPPAETAALRPRWDAHAVEQSLVNLIDNAIKHSPEGAAVRVALETAGARVLLCVEDRGPGIPPEEQAKIFDLFYRLGSELRRETQGAGIGLSIVKHVAEAHGGRVLVESAVGKGSRFTLELPTERP